MTYTPYQVVSHGFPFDDFMFTYNLADGIDASNVGQALTFDDSAASTLKLAGDGEPIHGRLFSVEDRDSAGMLVGTVQRKFKETLKAVEDHDLAVGDFVCGSTTPGLVRKAATDGSEPNTAIVVEVLADDYVAVESL